MAGVQFNDEYYLDVRPTDDVRATIEQLEKMKEYRGGTALYDAIIAVCKQLFSGPPGQERRIVLVLSDGQDNASSANEREAVRTAQDFGVELFAAGTGESGRTRGNLALGRLAISTGGRAFGGINPKRPEEFYAFLQRVLDSQYVLTYTPALPPPLKKHRAIDISSTDAGVLVVAPQGAMSQ